MSDEKLISSEVRAQQIKMLEIYKEASESDDTIKPFLQTLKKKLDKVLQAMEEDK